MKNKKLIGIIIAVVILTAVGILLVSSNNSNNHKFYKDYGTKVSKYTSIIYLTDDNIIESLSTNDKLVFMGRTTSKETKKAVKVLLEIAEENNIDKIYYYNTEGIAKKDDIVKKLTERIEREEIVSPILLLVKDKRVSSIEEGYNQNIDSKYEEIMIEYTMCTTPDC